MPKCANCNAELTCNCGSPQSIGQSANGCSLKKGSLWIHVMDDMAKNIAAVPVLKDGDEIETNLDGLAVFDPLDSKQYTAKLKALPSPLSDEYQPPTVLEKAVTVTDGAIAYADFTLTRKALLKVKVVSNDGKKVFDKAIVKIEQGQETKPEQSTTAGVADFGKVAAGKYSLKVELDEEDAKTFATTIEFGTSNADFNLTPGHIDECVIEVEPINVVTPKLELEYKVVLLDRKLSDYQDGGETKIFADPTCVQVSVRQSRKDDHPYAEGGNLSVATGPGDVDFFLDEGCKTPLDRDLTNNELTAEPPTKIYLRGKAVCKFELKLELSAPDDRFVNRDLEFVEEKMGTVELTLQMHQHVFSNLDSTATEVDPDIDPPALTGNETYDPFASSPQVPKPEKYHENLMKQYHTSLNDKVLPEQEELTDQQKFKMLDDGKSQSGRLLHVQKDDNHGRAKLVVAKVASDQLPDDTDDYEIYLNRTNKSGSVKIFDAEWEGNEKNFPVPFKLSELKTADQTVWVEGGAATSKACDVTLDLALDRPVKGLTKEAKRNADCVRLTVVEIKEVKVDYTAEPNKAVAWDETKQRFYINFKPGDAGRKVTIGAQLSKELKDVTIHFVLAPDKDNQKTANWGIDIPVGGKTPKGPITYSVGPGGDAANFSIQNDVEIYFDDGVLDAAVKNVYSVDINATDADNIQWLHQTKRIYVSEWGEDGTDTTGGINWIDVDPIVPTNIPLWKWNKIDASVKHKDKANSKKLLHLSAKTDEKGYAKLELTLSRFGGDKFQPAAYVDQDPHLGKYVHGHTDLEKKKPVFCDKTISVWRKIWYQRVIVEGINCPEFNAAVAQYERIKVEMVKAPDLEITRPTVNGYNPQAIYPMYMVRVNGGAGDALVVSDTNKGQFFTGFAAATDKPNMIPILVCDAQWDPHPDGDAGPVSSPELTKNQFPFDLDVGKQILNPPLQGGDLYVSGTWEAKDKNIITNGWENSRNGSLTNANLSITPNRKSLQHITISLPATVNAKINTRIWIKDLVVKAGKGYLGESFQQRILAVFDPSEAVDFQNTIAHEIGHAYHQVVRGDPAGAVDGVAKHPNQKDKGQGNHCRHMGNKCVMYDSGPITGSLNLYCPVCHPYLLVQDMTDIT